MSTELGTAAGATRSGDSPDGVSFRPATPTELRVCAEIWRDSINDYLAPRNVPLIPDDLGSITRLYSHLQATDPDSFVVATRASEAGDTASPDHIVGFGVAVQRDEVWFLSMLFVRPGAQGRGLGRALFEQVLPETRDRPLATATDSMQPISNALYASYGLVPRMPLLSLVGRPRRDSELPGLPSGVVSSRMAAGDTVAVDAVDDIALGYRHREDHAFIVAQGRQGFLYRDAGGSVLGYGYTSDVGRVGPAAVRDPALLWPVVAHLLTAVEPRGASAVWAPGHATDVVVGLLRAGFRIEDYPILLCWSKPFADFSRYVPISPGLL